MNNIQAKIKDVNYVFTFNDAVLLKEEYDKIEKNNAYNEVIGGIKIGIRDSSKNVSLMIKYKHLEYILEKLKNGGFKFTHEPAKNVYGENVFFITIELP